MHKAMAALTATIVLAAGLAVADTAATKSPSTTKPSTKPKTKSSTATKSPTRAKSSASTRKSTATKKGSTSKASTTAHRRPSTPSHPAQSWRTRQTQPTPERYKEIQQALQQKGYLNGEPTGTWNQDSIDALRRFQQDQKLESTGKIDSLSLIALGLGPKHETAVAVPPREPLPAAQEPEPATR